MGGTVSVQDAKVVSFPARLQESRSDYLHWFDIFTDVLSFLHSRNEQWPKHVPTEASLVVLSHSLYALDDHSLRSTETNYAT